jgi:acyl carrier protein
MPGTTTFDRLCAILMKDYKLEAGQLTPEAPLEALGIDSLGVADLLFNIEDAFGISLPPASLPWPG